MDKRERARRQRAFTKDAPKKGYCATCGKLRKLVADHKQPVTLGGAFTPENRSDICASCHGKKTRREQSSPFEFIP